MLNYLSEIKSPLHHFLCNHSRVNEMTSINPYPKIKTYVLSLNEYPRTYLGEQPIPVTTKMTSTMLLNNLVYAFVRTKCSRSEVSENFYIGSRIAGTNRNVEHLASLRRHIRNSDSSYSSGSSLVEYVLKEGGWANKCMVILLQEPSLRKEFIHMYPNYVNNINEEDILLFFDRWIIRVQEQAFISVLQHQCSTSVI